MVGSAEVEKNARIDFLEDGGLILCILHQLFKSLKAFQILGSRIGFIFCPEFLHHSVEITEEPVFMDIDVEDVLTTHEVDMGTKLQILSGLPGNDGIGSKTGGAERIAEVEVEKLGTTYILPCGSEVR